jgi:hypothetical protein
MSKAQLLEAISTVETEIEEEKKEAQAEIDRLNQFYKDKAEAIMTRLDDSEWLLVNIRRAIKNGTGILVLATVIRDQYMIGHYLDKLLKIKYGLGINIRSLESNTAYIEYYLHISDIKEFCK